MTTWLNAKRNKNGTLSFFEDHGFKHLAIYGLGLNGKILFDEFKNSHIKVDYCIDKNKANIKIDSPLYDLSDDLPDTEVIIITPMLSFYEIKEELEKKVDISLYSIEEVLDWGKLNIEENEI